jgi:hypothetical protein
MMTTTGADGVEEIGSMASPLVQLGPDLFRVRAKDTTIQLQ